MEYSIPGLAVLVLKDYHSDRVDIFNAQGVLVKEIAVNVAEMDFETSSLFVRIDTFELPAGVYFAGYTAKDGRHNFVKFIVGS